jgi:peptidylprolyl isomerase
MFNIKNIEKFSMRQARSGDMVKVHYTGQFDDGQVFGSTLNGEPLEFRLGQGKFIKCFEDAVVGMYEREKKLIKIPLDEACGPYQEDLLLRVDRADLPPNIDPQKGLVLNFKKPDGEVLIEATVADVNQDSVALDFNHPLAGKNLMFTIELIEITQDKSPQDEKTTRLNRTA